MASNIISLAKKIALNDEGVQSRAFFPCMIRTFCSDIDRLLNPYLIWDNYTVDPNFDYAVHPWTTAVKRCQFDAGMNVIRDAGVSVELGLLESVKAIDAEFCRSMVSLVDKYESQEFTDDDRCDDGSLCVLSDFDLAQIFIRSLADRLELQVKNFESFVQRAKDKILGRDSGTPKPPRKHPERDLEQELYLWLIGSNVCVEKQVSTKSRHRLDLWIPGTCFLEVKADKVSADDVCQALDYFATYRKPVVLIGKSISSSAARGIAAVSDLMADGSIVFISWGASKDYLSRILGL